MFTAIKNFISSVFSSEATIAKQSNVIETVLAVDNSITNNILPVLNNVLELDKGVLNKNKTLTAINKLSNTRFTDNVDLINKIKEFFLEIQDNKDTLIATIKSNCPSVITVKTLTFKQAAILKVVNDLTSMSLFVLDLVNAFLALETGNGTSNLSKAQLASLDACSRDFVAVFDSYYKKLNKLIKDLKDVSAELINQSESDTTNNIISSTNGKQIDLPSDTNGFLGNPIYHIRMWFVERSLAKLQILEDKKKLIELRIQQIRANEKNLPDEQIAKMINYYEEELSNIEYKITKIKED